MTSNGPNLFVNTEPSVSTNENPCPNSIKSFPNLIGTTIERDDRHQELFVYSQRKQCQSNEPMPLNKVNCPKRRMIKSPPNLQR